MNLDLPHDCGGFSFWHFSPNAVQQLAIRLILLARLRGGFQKIQEMSDGLNRKDEENSARGLYTTYQGHVDIFPYQCLSFSRCERISRMVSWALWHINVVQILLLLFVILNLCCFVKITRTVASIGVRDIFFGCCAVLILLD